MFEDMDLSLREMGAGDMGVGKRVKAMVKAFYGRIVYEAGLGTSDDELVKALTRNVYGTTVPNHAGFAALRTICDRRMHILPVQALLRLKMANSNSCRLMGETLKNMSCEFSRPHDLRELAEAPHSIELIAADAECKSLALRFGQQSIRNLRASLTLEWLVREKILLFLGVLGLKLCRLVSCPLNPLGRS